MASADDISNWYTQYLGRSASPDEVQGWTSGAYGGDPFNQIQNSGEAAQYKASQQPAAAAPAASSGGPSASDISNWYTQYLGRSASPDEITGWTSGAYGGSPLAQIQGSGEAAQYRASLASGLNTGGPAATAPAPAPATPATPSVYSGNGPIAEGATYGSHTTDYGGGPVTIPPNPTGQAGQWVKQADGSFVWKGSGGATTPTTPASTTGGAADPFKYGNSATNMYGGVTYAGFSPQDHPNVNLQDPMNAKYALQQYMIDNGALTGGQGGNAQQIAAALNAKYGAAYGDANFFKATDAETILMPDGQYVHAAPNGYGMASGTYDPSAKSEVFWGAQGGSGGSGGGGGTTTTGGGGGGTTTVPKSTTTTGGGNPFQSAGTGNPFAFDPGSYYSASGGSATGGMVDPSTQLYNQNLRLQLLSQLGILGTPTTDKSETIQPALSAYNNQSQRDQQDNRDAIAERFYAQGGTGGSGLDSGAFNSAVIKNMETGASARDTFAGNLVYQDNIQRRQQLQAMMQTAVQAGQTDAAQQIEAAIAVLNAKISEQGLQQGFQQANDNTAFNYYNTDAATNRALIGGALGQS